MEEALLATVFQAAAVGYKMTVSKKGYMEPLRCLAGELL